MREKFKIERIIKLLRWFYPGIGIKRWIAVSAFGIAILIIGIVRITTSDKEAILLLRVLDGILIFLGVALLISGVRRALRSFIIFFFPEWGKKRELVDFMYQRWQLERGPNIVAIGGGHGLSVLLGGLREFTSNISAIVTVADNGGSTGRLRQQFDILAPGDIRNCLVALADAPALMRDLFQFRFDSSSPELAGHNFGNLFITVMTQITGDFDKAIKESSKVLAIRGQVLPSTLDNVNLVAEYKDGTITEGESNIPEAKQPIKRIWLNPQGVHATEEAIWAIKQAQIIAFGPGSLYTSIIPNLLIKELCDAIVASNALKVYICNIMTQQGETDNFTAFDHLNVLIQHTHPKIVDYCLVNTGDVSEELRQRYKQEGSYPISPEIHSIRNMGYRVIGDNLITICNNYIRHDPNKLARIILGLIEEI